jgi:hypothetical protein
MLWTNLFFKYEFDGRKASEFLAFFHELADSFELNRFDNKEPVRHPINWDDLREPGRLLAGAPGDHAGAILLKGARHRFLAVVSWNRLKVLPWSFYLSCKFFEKAGSVEKFVVFVSAIVERFPIVYGWAAPEEDWDAKHWRQDGLSKVKSGTTLEEGLPGIYWMTIFGPTLVDHFGRERLKSLPVHRVVDLGAAGIMILIRKSPSDTELPERLRQDHEIMEILGLEYFFDIGKPHAVTSPIPGVTKLSSDQTSEPSGQGDSSFPEDPAEAFEFQDVRSPDGDPFSSPEALADMLVVYLHTEIDGLEDYSRRSLQLLDDYLQKHPAAEAYSTEHLMMEFIPALGAYLGHVLVKQLSASWDIASPLMRSGVRVGNEVIYPFRHAYRCVYKEGALAQFYDNAANSLTR